MVFVAAFILYVCFCEGTAAVFGRGAATSFLEHPGKVVVVIEADRLGDFHQRRGVGDQQFFGLVDASVQHVVHDRFAHLFAKCGFAVDGGKGCGFPNVFQGDLSADVAMDVFDDLADQRSVLLRRYGVFKNGQNAVEKMFHGGHVTVKIVMLFNFVKGGNEQRDFAMYHRSHHQRQVIFVAGIKVETDIIFIACAFTSLPDAACRNEDGIAGFHGDGCAIDVVNKPAA